MRSEWPVVLLGDHCVKIGSGATPKGGKEAYLDAGPYRLIRSQNVYNEGFSWQGLAFISEEQARRLDGVSVQAGDVLVNITGDSVARVCKAPATALPARVNQHVAIVRPREKSFDADFLRWYLCAPEQQEKLLGLASAGATRNALTKGMLEGLKVPKPPMETQRQLVAPLVAIEQRIQLLRQTNAVLESIAQAMFKSWFIDFDPVRAKAEGREPEGMEAATAALFPSEFDESALGLIPKGWRVGDIYEVADVRYGAPFASKLFNTTGDGLPLIRIRDLKDEAPGVWTPEMHPKGSKVCPGDIVVGMDGEFRAYLWGGETAWMNQRICMFKPKNGHCAAFVRSAIAGPLAHVEATETATTVIHLGKGDIDRFRVIVPPPAVARAFASLCQPLYDRIVTGKQTSRTLAAVRDNLLPRLISGKLRVPDARTAVEEAAA